MRYLIALALAGIGCTGSSDYPTPAPVRVDAPAPAGDMTPAAPTSPPDMAPPAAQPDLAPTAPLPQPDMAPAWQPAPDLGHVATMDMTPVIDQSCGKMGQIACADGCTLGLYEVVSGDQCGAPVATACTLPLNCGGAGLPCCTTLGQPTLIGYCATGSYCGGGSCHRCAS